MPAYKWLAFSTNYMQLFYLFLSPISRASSMPKPAQTAMARTARSQSAAGTTSASENIFSLKTSDDTAVSAIKTPAEAVKYFAARSLPG